METTHPHTLNFTGVVSESKKIILSKYTHFITLSLFFLPLSFFLTTSLRLPDLPFAGDHSNHQQLLNHHLIYTVIIYILTLCAISTITYTTHQVFSGSPDVTISDAVKSLTSSFLHLASTAIVAQVLLVLIAQSFFLLVGTLLMLVQNLGFVIDRNSTSFMWISAISCAILIAIEVYIYNEWSLAFVIVVVESKWGFKPLIRSSYLIKGMRSVSLFLMLYSGVCGAIIVSICLKNFDDQHRWPFVVLTMLGSFFLMMILLRITSANTVLYNYCKALHGELVIEVDDGFDHEYNSLFADDDKVPHVVTVVTT